MTSPLGRKLLTLPATVLGVVTVVFLLVHVLPGDPVDAMLGEQAAVADREALRRALGLDRPLGEQFIAYLGGLARGDLGRSLHGNEPVASRIAGRLPATGVLALAAATFALAVALPLGTLAAARPRGVAAVVASLLSTCGAALPNFVIGPVLVLVFAVELGWVPVSGAASLGSLVLPAVTLGLGMAAILTRLVRTALHETLAADFVRTARAKGLAEGTVLRRHALRNALLPVTTLVGLQLGGLLGGAIVKETIFAWPGIGSLALEAIQSRDYPLVQGCVLVIALAYVAVNFATDLLYARLDPRIRLGAREVG